MQAVGQLEWLTSLIAESLSGLSSALADQVGLLRSMYAGQLIQ